MIPLRSKDLFKLYCQIKEELLHVSTKDNKSEVNPKIKSAKYW
jgi:hypothetical protein